MHMQSVPGVSAVKRRKLKYCHTHEHLMKAACIVMLCQTAGGSKFIWMCNGYKEDQVDVQEFRLYELHNAEELFSFR